MSGATTGVISARALCKEFVGSGGTQQVLSGLDLTVEPGEFVAVLGPSGCGKSTLLSLLGGFEGPTAGEVLLDGEPLKGPDRRVVTIFQDYGLFPWRSVLGNVEFGMAAVGVPTAKRREEAARWLEVVGLSDYASAQVSELSGGMRQRVNLARALAVGPEVLLMDEPMGALDAITRANVQEQLRDILRGAAATVVLVTHDVDEALFLADRVIVMSQSAGAISEEISVRIRHPRDRASADFSHLRARLLSALHLAHISEPEYGI